MSKKAFWILRIALLCVAALLIIVPITIVETTQVGFSPLASHLLLSGSILSVIAAVWASPDWNSKDKRFVRGAVSIGLLIVLISLWR